MVKHGQSPIVIFIALIKVIVIVLNIVIVIVKVKFLDYKNELKFGYNLWL